MSKRHRRHKCCHCRQLYDPDPRSRHHQKHCSKPDCQKASKAASQRKWRGSDNGRDYFLGPANAYRVRDWRRRNPGYAKKRKKPSRALQEDSLTQVVVPPADTSTLNQSSTAELRALQDVCHSLRLTLTGLIAKYTGALQDEIAPITQQLVRLGQQILGPAAGVPNAGFQASALQGAVAQSAPAVQLDRPSPGP